MSLKSLPRIFLGLIVCTAATAFVAQIALAEEAEDMLDSAPAAPTASAANSAAKVEQKVAPEISSSQDSFQHFVARELSQQRRLNYDVHEWAGEIISGDITKAAHLWTAIQPNMSENFETTAQAGYLYSLWRLKLSHVFLTEWFKALNKSAYARSSAEVALEQYLEPGFDQWLVREAPLFSAREVALLKKLTTENAPKKNSVRATLLAWASLRNPTEAAAAITGLAANNDVRPFLAKTIAVEKSKSGDLKGAAQELRTEFQPWIESHTSLNELAEKDIFLARMLFESGKMEAARDYYLRIPNNSPDFLRAQEELTWVYLRLNDTARVRGSVQVLTSNLFDDHFFPESFVVRSISNLKLCFYDKVEKDFNDFNRVGSQWAKKIDAALSTTDSKISAPPVVDVYTAMAQRNLGHLEQEQLRVKKLANESIEAVLPAVGVQSHWLDAENDLTTAVGDAKRHELSEYHRQWRNMRTEMAEAIRKMRFVKLEFMSELRTLTKDDQPAVGQKLASNTQNAGQPAVVSDVGGTQMVFPVDGEVWPDELFKLRSTAQARCLKGANP